MPSTKITPQNTRSTIPEPMTTLRLLTIVRGYFPSRARSIGEHLEKEIGLYTLGKGKALYLIASDLDVDSDGSRLSGDATSQSETSLYDRQGRSLDANAVPFFVLPGIHDGVASNQVKLGGMVMPISMGIR